MSAYLDIVKRWITYADHDLGTAIITFKHLPKYKETISFHCQQAIEKYLKGYLVFLETEFIHSHDLLYLINLIEQKDSDFNLYYTKLSRQQNISVKLRYPDEIIYPTDEDIQQALNMAKEIRELVLNKINITIETDDIITHFTQSKE